MIDVTIVNVAIPSIVRSFPGSSPAQVSWVLSAYSVCFAAFVVTGGRLADMVGRRRVFSAALASFTVASMLCALAPTLPVLIAARSIQAIGTAFMVPASRGLLLEAYPSERRTHAIAMWTAIGATAAAIGPVLGGVLIAAANWRLVFLVNLPLGVCGLLLARRELVESRAAGRRRLPDIGGSIIFALAVGVFLIGLVQGQDWGWSSPPTLVAFAVAAAVMAVFARRCLSRPDPLIDPRLFGHRSFTVSIAMTVFSSAGFYSVLLSAVLFLTGVWHYSSVEAGLAIAPAPLIAIVVAPWCSRMVDRIGLRGVLGLGLVAWVAATVWALVSLGSQREFLAGWLPASLLFGAGAGLTTPTLSSASVLAARGTNHATVTGISTVSRQVGTALGVAATVAILGTPSPGSAVAAFEHTWLFALACFLAIGLGLAGLGRLVPTRATTVVDEPSSARAVTDLLADPPQRYRSGVLRPNTGRTADSDRPETVAALLRRVPMLGSLAPEVIDRLAARTRIVGLKSGEWLFRAGEQAASMFVIRAGRLRVLQESPTSRVLRELGRGEVLGELALLTGEVRSASVRAARDSELIAIDRSDFLALLDDSAELGRELAVGLAGQLRESGGIGSRRRPIPVTIALVSCDGGRLATEVAAPLAAALGRHGSAAVLDAEDAPRLVSYAEAAATFAPLLERRELTHDRVLLVAGDPRSPTPWTGFCLQQADRILLLTEGGSPPRGTRLRRPAARL